MTPPVKTRVNVFLDDLKTMFPIDVPGEADLTDAQIEAVRCETERLARELVVAGKLDEKWSIRSIYVPSIDAYLRPGKVDPKRVNDPNRYYDEEKLDCSRHPSLEEVPAPLPVEKKKGIPTFAFIPNIPFQGTLPIITEFAAKGEPRAPGGYRYINISLGNGALEWKPKTFEELVQSTNCTLSGGDSSMGTFQLDCGANATYETVQKIANNVKQKLPQWSSVQIHELGLSPIK